MMHSDFSDKACVEFLQRCLVKLRYRWAGYRKIRSQVCKRIKRRITELHLSGFDEYHEYLENNTREWEVLDSLCYVTISRFYRDRAVFETLQNEILPHLAEESLKQKKNELHVWSAGCCSGEEPYTVNILWKLSRKGWLTPCVKPKLETEIECSILATERSDSLLKRARHAVYSKSSLKDLPDELKSQAFEKQNDHYKLKQRFIEGVTFINQDIRDQTPDGNFDLVLCRNLVFTYFQEDLQKAILEKIVECLEPGGFLVTGIHESLPDGCTALKPYKKNSSIFQKFL
ncbi:CheR family methyltransferase [candidate division KSB1 bacterium]